MKLNNLVKVKIKNHDFYRFCKILSSKEISFDRAYVNKDFFILILSYLDFKKLTKLLKSKDYEVITFYGLIGIKNFLKKHLLFMISICIGILIMYTLSNMIFNIQINISDQKIKERVILELEENGIEQYKFKKSFLELERIKNKILKNNKDILEWMSIEVDGTSYIINANLRVLEEETTDGNISDIVAKKDGKILHIESSKGVIVKDINDYVKKGETIISGNIIKSDKYLKGQVESIGKVYAEVWYTVDISVPLKYVEYQKINLNYNEYFIYLFGKKITLINDYNIDNIMYKESIAIAKPYLPFKIYKRETSAYKYIETNLTEEEAYNLCIKKATDKIQITLSNDEYIIDKNVLKKELNSSKMVLRIFFKVYENITEKKEIEKIEYNTDITKKGS